MTKHYNIPIFMPELACPFQCIYCNQATISGQSGFPDSADIVALIERNLQSLPTGKKHVDIAFFGGNFTGLPLKHQADYLDLVLPYLYDGRVQGIRLSTRPDYINDEVLLLLKAKHVHTIELGAQSLDDEVLARCGRGHTLADVALASSKIRELGFRLALQMMIGLPGDTAEKSLQTAKTIINLGAHETRIYPCLVVRGTALEQQYHNNEYTPLSLEEAVSLSASLLTRFESAGVKVIRLGLHPSEGLNGDALVAGPFHPAFKELVMTEIWRQLFISFPAWPTGPASIIIEVPGHEFNFAVGYAAANKNMLRKRFPKLQFVCNSRLTGRDFIVKPDIQC